MNLKEQRHQTRVFMLCFFSVFFTGFIFVIISAIMYFFKIGINGFYYGCAVFLLIFFLWFTNARIGFIENMIEGKQRYEPFKVWHPKIK